MRPIHMHFNVGSFNDLHNEAICFLSPGLSSRATELESVCVRRDGIRDITRPHNARNAPEAQLHLQAARYSSVISLIRRTGVSPFSRLFCIPFRSPVRCWKISLREDHSACNFYERLDAQRERGEGGER